MGALWNPATSADGWFASPDNCTIDALGRLWVCDGPGRGLGARPARPMASTLSRTEGEERGLSKLFFRVPVGAELCGPVLHARWRDGVRGGAASGHGRGASDWKPFGRESTFEDPATRWPDFKPDMPPRPSIVAIRKKGGGKIASS